MSKPGDVVWADGRSWQRDDEWEQEPKQWWIAPTHNQLTLKELKRYDDFCWLVKNGVESGDKRGGEDERRAIAAWNEGVEEGKAGERDAIVAWLLSWENRRSPANLARDIERGKHLREDG